MANVVPWLHLLVGAPLVHRVTCLRVTPLDSISKSITSLMSFSLLILGSNLSLPCVTAVSLKRRRHEQASS
jgi:hypothetical protein